MQEGARDSDSDDEIDKYGVVKRHFDVATQVERWRHVIREGPSELKNTSLIYDKNFGIGSQDDIVRRRSMAGSRDAVEPLFAGMN